MKQGSSLQCYCILTGGPLPFAGAQAPLPMRVHRPLSLCSHIMKENIHVSWRALMVYMRNFGGIRSSESIFILYKHKEDLIFGTCAQKSQAEGKE